MRALNHSAAAKNAGKVVITRAVLDINPNIIVKDNGSQKGSLSASGRSPAKVVTEVASRGRNLTATASDIASFADAPLFNHLVSIIQQHDCVINNNTYKTGHANNYKETEWVVGCVKAKE